MADRKMHEDEVDTDVRLVGRLLAAQFPEWADLPVQPVDSSGTVNALYRLGDGMVVRLRRTPRWGDGAITRDLRWLPKLAPLLPAEIPVPLAKGLPGEGFPWEWGVYRWLEGQNPTVDGLADAESLARELARFVEALHGIRLPGGPPAPRGSSLVRWDEGTRAFLRQLEGIIDTSRATAAWDVALQTPDWTGPPVWTHGDLMPANLVVQHGSLSGVIDWEIMGMADPACDLAVAWNLLSVEARRVFRDELDVDEDTWARGRGWALWTGIGALAYYAETNAELAENGRYRIGEVLADLR